MNKCLGPDLWLVDYICSRSNTPQNKIFSTFKEAEDFALTTTGNKSEIHPAISPLYLEPTVNSLISENKTSVPVDEFVNGRFVLVTNDLEKPLALTWHLHDENGFEACFEEFTTK